MKTAILSAALMLASTVAMAQTSNFKLKVDLKNFTSDSVLVYKGRNVKMDTVLVKNGKFTYSANLDKAAGYVFLSPEAYRGSGLFVFNLPCLLYTSHISRSRRISYQLHAIAETADEDGNLYDDFG